MNLFENIAKIIRNGASTSIAINKRVYGVQCRVYFPKKEAIPEEEGYKNYHYSDIYEMEPDIEDTFLIPQVYSYNNDNNFLNDPLTDDEYICYTDYDKEIPLYSKFEIVLDNIQNKFFYVDKIENFQTTSIKVVKKLHLIPLIEQHISNEDEEDEIKDMYIDFDDIKSEDDFQSDIYAEYKKEPSEENKNPYPSPISTPNRKMQYTELQD